MDVSTLMKECAQLALKIDANPDYPIQLFYADGVFSAMYEPNMDSAIFKEGATAEEALYKKKKEIENA